MSFNREIIFKTQDGSLGSKLCNDSELDDWKYFYKTYYCEVIEIKEINP